MDKRLKKYLLIILSALVVLLIPLHTLGGESLYLNTYLTIQFGFDWNSMFFSTDTQTDTEYSESVYYKAYSSVFIRISQSSTIEQFLGFTYTYNLFETINTHNIGATYWIKANEIFLGGGLYFKTGDLLNYLNYFELTLNLDFYPNFFINNTLHTPFYPMKLFSYEEYYTAETVTETFDYKGEIGFYLYQNEIFAGFSYTDSKQYETADTYEEGIIYDFSFNMRLIPTYTSLGYNISFGYAQNTLTESGGNSFSYSFLYAEGGLIYKFFSQFYIIASIGYNFFYLPPLGTGFSVKSPLRFKFQFIMGF